LAMTPTVTDVEGDFNPQSSMAMKARILSKGFSKLTIPIAESRSTLLILNQLKLNIGADGNPKYMTQSQKFFTPGGKSPAYAYSLRVWLTGSKAKDSFVEDSKGYRVGSLVKARLEKSRFGTQGRSCEFQIMWADRVGVLDDESLFEAIKSSPSLTVGAWNTLEHNDGTSEKFRSADWAVKMKEPKFRERVFELLNEEVILKFDKREGPASQFYENHVEEFIENEEAH
jgi:RecA/RadA recombinase